MYTTGPARLYAISDLHVRHEENRVLLDGLRPASPADWIVVAGDVGERTADIRWALERLTERFARVIWAPGNHELWTVPGDTLGARGVARYQELVAVCHELGVVTPDDPYPVFQNEDGPVAVAPLFVLYDYSFRPDGARTKRESLARAFESGIVATDELLLHPDPYPSREAWCEARVAETERRLEELPPGLPVVLVNHFPLVREPTRVLRHQEFALWCGTERTAGWHLRFPVKAVVYGHLHIRRTTVYDGVPFVEASVGYPREWAGRNRPTGLVQVLPLPIE